MESELGLGKAIMRDERLLELFSTSPSLTAIYEKMRQQLLANVQNLLRNNAVSRSTDLQLLAARFGNCEIPEEPISVKCYLDEFRQNVLPYSINMLSPRCMGHMAGVVPSFVRMFGEIIVALNQNLVKKEASRSFTLLERQTLAMVHKLIFASPSSFYDKHVHREASTLGIITSGGTVANLTALWIARNSCLGPINEFTGIEEEGLPAALNYYGFEDAVVLGSQLAHYSIEKSATILGLGLRNLVRLPVDRNGRADVRALRGIVSEYRSRRICIIAIIATAGTTDSGSIDPLSEIADVAHESRIHFHVDAAWGAPLLFSRRHSHKLAGIERADSVTVDGHKQFYIPMSNSLLLLRDPHLAKLIEKQSPYMLQKRSGDLGKYSLEGSRPANILFFHAALRTIGRRGYEFLIDQNIRRAKVMAKAISARDEFHLLIQPTTNIVLYRYIPKACRRALALGKLTNADCELINEWNLRIQKAQFEAGHTFVSRTLVSWTPQAASAPIVALRAVITNPLTTNADIDAVLDDQINVAARVAGQKPILHRTKERRHSQLSREDNAQSDLHSLSRSRLRNRSDSRHN
jgi:putative pyridoxal-dependent aspartate 1-decarboxylase